MVVYQTGLSDIRNWTSRADNIRVAYYKVREVVYSEATVELVRVNTIEV